MTDSTGTQLQMRSLIRANGEFELSLASAPIPEPGPNEVLIRVQAAPLNPSDLGLVFGAAALMDLVGDRPEGMVVKPNLALAASLTTLGQRYPGSLMGTMAFFRQALIDGAYHRAEMAAYEKAPGGKKRPAFDPGLDVWADVASGTTPLLLQTSREIGRAHV